MRTPRRAAFLFLLALSLAAPSCRDRSSLAEKVSAKEARGERKAAAPVADEDEARKVRRSALAGSWYPGNAEKLAGEVDGFLEKVDTKERLGGLVALVSPHAGYRYSGQAAAYGYRQAAGRGFKRVVILAPSHHVSFRGASIPAADFYETPLGLVPVDREAREKLLSYPLFSTRPDAHLREHSLEIQLPFLQRALGDFLLVPVVFSNLAEEDYAAVAEALRPLIDRKDVKTLLVASSDFTHYGRRFGYYPFKATSDDELREKLKALDMGAVEPMLALDGPGFRSYQRKTGATICGRVPIAVLLEILTPRKSELKATLLKYYTSLDVTGDASSTVSYVSAAFYKGGSGPPTPYSPASSAKEGGLDKKEAAAKKREDPPPTPTPLRTIGAAERRTLLKLARDTVRMYVNRRETPDLGDYDITPRLKEIQGAFVTLNDPRGRLRGCIGHIVGRKPLAETVLENAVSAAVRDRRFSPVRPEEVAGLAIEISAMSPLEKVSGAEEIVLGVHGVVLRKGYKRSVYLPQVATETGWSKEKFLRRLSMKAGLSPDAWKTAELQVFRAEVFSEEKSTH